MNSLWFLNNSPPSPSNTNAPPAFRSWWLPSLPPGTPQAPPPSPTVLASNVNTQLTTQPSAFTQTVINWIYPPLTPTTPTTPTPVIVTPITPTPVVITPTPTPTPTVTPTPIVTVSTPPAAVITFTPLPPLPAGTGNKIFDAYPESDADFDLIQSRLDNNVALEGDSEAVYPDGRRIPMRVYLQKLLDFQKSLRKSGNSSGYTNTYGLNSTITLLEKSYNTHTLIYEPHERTYIPPEERKRQENELIMSLKQDIKDLKAAMNAGVAINTLTSSYNTATTAPATMATNSAYAPPPQNVQNIANTIPGTATNSQKQIAFQLQHVAPTNTTLKAKAGTMTQLNAVLLNSTQTNTTSQSSSLVTAASTTTKPLLNAVAPKIATTTGSGQNQAAQQQLEEMKKKAAAKKAKDEQDRLDALAAAAAAAGTPPAVTAATGAPSLNTVTPPGSTTPTPIVPIAKPVIVSNYNFPGSLNAYINQDPALITDIQVALDIVKKLQVNNDVRAPLHQYDAVDLPNDFEYTLPYLDKVFADLFKDELNDTATYPHAGKLREFIEEIRERHPDYIKQKKEERLKLDASLKTLRKDIRDEILKYYPSDLSNFTRSSELKNIMLLYPKMPRAIALRLKNAPMLKFLHTNPVDLRTEFNVLDLHGVNFLDFCEREALYDLLLDLSENSTNKETKASAVQYLKKTEDEELKCLKDPSLLNTKTYKNPVYIPANYYPTTP